MKTASTGWCGTVLLSSPRMPWCRREQSLSLKKHIGVTMPQDRTRKIVIAGILGAISIFLGITKWGFLPWIGGASITIMTVPVVIGAILEGPGEGFAIGLIFGGFS